jgi:hypothetical protein
MQQNGGGCIETDPCAPSLSRKGYARIFCGQITGTLERWGRRTKMSVTGPVLEELP